METYNKFKDDLNFNFKLFIVIIWSIIGYEYFFENIDSTDKNQYNRSDMKLHTDNLTGLQYLSVKNGGIIPRLNIEGKHMNIMEDNR